MGVYHWGLRRCCWWYDVRCLFFVKLTRRCELRPRHERLLPPDRLLRSGRPKERIRSRTPASRSWILFISGDTLVPVTSTAPSASSIIGSSNEQRQQNNNCSLNPISPLSLRLIDRSSAPYQGLEHTHCAAFACQTTVGAVFLGLIQSATPEEPSPSSKWLSNSPSAHLPPLRSLPSAATGPAPLTSSSPPPPPTSRHRLSCSLPLQPAA
jgi:hypothetical protein